MAGKSALGTGAVDTFEHVIVQEVNGDTSFFLDVSTRLKQASSQERAEVIRHLEYLADKTKTSASSILSGEPFRAQKQVHEDAKHNINASLGARPTKPKPVLGPSYIIDTIALAETILEGWCTREKAMAISDIITAEKPQICVEIGVYGGRSLVPAAAALRMNGSGSIYGIETWRPDVAVEHATNAENDAWWQKIDFHALKTNFLRFVAEHDLASQIRIVEAPSANAAALFNQIDYLHIDGAHSIYNAAEDAVLYSKKVKREGIIIMDDAEWPSTAPAISILDSIGERIATFRNDRDELSCIVYRKKTV